MIFTTLPFFRFLSTNLSQEKLKTHNKVTLRGARFFVNITWKRANKEARWIKRVLMRFH